MDCSSFKSPPKPVFTSSQTTVSPILTSLRGHLLYQIVLSLLFLFDDDIVAGKVKKFVMLKDTERQMKFFSLRLQGKTLLEISAELEISLSTANRWNKFFKADIINARNSDMERLRRKIAEKYDKYFNFLDENFDRLNAEVHLHKDIAMTYGGLLKYSTKILDSINKIDIFRKFADKSARDSAPEDTIPETDYSQSYVPKHVIEGLKKC